MTRRDKQNRNVCIGILLLTLFAVGIVSLCDCKPEKKAEPMSKEERKELQEKDQYQREQAVYNQGGGGK